MTREAQQFAFQPDVQILTRLFAFNSNILGQFLGGTLPTSEESGRKLYRDVWHYFLRSRRAHVYRLYDSGFYLVTVSVKPRAESTFPYHEASNGTPRRLSLDVRVLRVLEPSGR